MIRLAAIAATGLVLAMTMISMAKADDFSACLTQFGLKADLPGFIFTKCKTLGNLVIIGATGTMGAQLEVVVQNTTKRTIASAAAFIATVEHNYAKDGDKPLDFRPIADTVTTAMLKGGKLRAAVHIRVISINENKDVTVTDPARIRHERPIVYATFNAGGYEVFADLLTKGQDNVRPVRPGVDRTPDLDKTMVSILGAIGPVETASLP